MAMKLTTASAVSTLALSMPAFAQAIQRIAVPGFFPLNNSCAPSSIQSPGCTRPALGSDWSRIERAGPTVLIVVADGSFETLSGTNLTDAQTQFKRNRAAGQLVLGYVDSATGTRPITCTGTHPCSVMDDVAQWYSNYVAPFPNDSRLDGIFFDNGPLDNGTLTAAQDAQFNSYYTQLRQQVTQNFPTFKVMLNASQYPNNWVLSVADFLTMYERPEHGVSMQSCPPNFKSDQQDYIGTSCSSTNCLPVIPPSLGFCPWIDHTTNCGSVQTDSVTGMARGWYFDSANAPKIAHLVRAVTSATDVPTIIGTSRASYGAPGLLYIHHQNCDPQLGALYGQLSDYFEQLVAALNPSLDVVIPVTNASTGTTVWVPLSF
jgi:Spherulation-specific family 4